MRRSAASVDILIVGWEFVVDRLLAPILESGTARVVDEDATLLFLVGLLQSLWQKSSLLNSS